MSVYEALMVAISFAALMVAIVTDKNEKNNPPLN
ncbi:putative holin-like toxin [Oceanobacillus picturae]|nr:putative holin-like toxin [Oceanobacillus picturae]